MDDDEGAFADGQGRGMQMVLLPLALWKPHCWAPERSKMDGDKRHNSGQWMMQRLFVVKTGAFPYARFWGIVQWFPYFRSFRVQFYQLSVLSIIRGRMQAGSGWMSGGGFTMSSKTSFCAYPISCSIWRLAPICIPQKGKSLRPLCLVEFILLYKTRVCPVLNPKNVLPSDFPHTPATAWPSCLSTVGCLSWRSSGSANSFTGQWTMAIEVLKAILFGQPWALFSHK